MSKRDLRKARDQLVIGKIKVESKCNDVVRQKVLVSATPMQSVMALYRPVFEKNGIDIVTIPVEANLTEDELLTVMGDIDGVICGDDQFTRRVLKAAPKLKVISKWGTGVDAIDLGTARELGIQVLNVPGVFSDAVADTVMGYVLAFGRRLFAMDIDVRSGSWKQCDLVSLNESVLGIIGVGHIGKAVIRRAVAFGIKVLGNDIVEVPQDFLLETGLKMVSKDALLNKADFVSLNCDLNQTSYHLIGKCELSVMKSTSYLINTARGAVVDEPTLIKALRTRQIAGAALDVFESEPLPLDSPLRSLSNCFLAPHNANSSTSAWRKCHELAIRHLIDGLESSKKNISTENLH